MCGGEYPVLELSFKYLLFEVALPSFGREYLPVALPLRRGILKRSFQPFLHLFFSVCFHLLKSRNWFNEVNCLVFRTLYGGEHDHACADDSSPARHGTVTCFGLSMEANTITRILAIKVQFIGITRILAIEDQFIGMTRILESSVCWRLKFTSSQFCAVDAQSTTITRKLT